MHTASVTLFYLDEMIASGNARPSTFSHCSSKQAQPSIKPCAPEGPLSPTECNGVFQADSVRSREDSNAIIVQSIAVVGNSAPLLESPCH